MVKAQKVQEEWAKRDDDINSRLCAAHDQLAAAQPGPFQADARVAVDALTEERDNFFLSRSQAKAAMAEERTQAKRKLEAELARQRSYNKTVKGDARKKMKAAVEAATPQEAAAAAPAVGSSSASTAVAQAARARMAAEDAALARALAVAAIKTAIGQIDSEAA